MGTACQAIEAIERRVSTRQLHCQRCFDTLLAHESPVMNEFAAAVAIAAVAVSDRMAGCISRELLGQFANLFN